MLGLFNLSVGLVVLALSAPLVAVQAADSASPDRADGIVRIAAGPPHGMPAGTRNSAKAGDVQASDDKPGEDNAGDDKELTPAQKMQKRFPQPALVSHLIGLPVLDDNDSTIGYIRQVVRSPDGKISLIVPYSRWFGWLPVAWGKRPVAVPIEVVTILARQLDSVDMQRGDYDDAATWQPSQGQPLAPDEKILVALGRR
ncbi:MAG: hypothetical protein B7Y71_00735 [Xanthobacter sp. 35-67-6]|nr:MAG: hypothetical protein B7Y71_00735 [Xanthobacter sp. 35-67-6]